MPPTTFPTLSQMTPAEVVRAAQSHYENAVALAFMAKPEFRGNSDFGYLLTGLPSPLGNMVVGTNLSDGEANVAEVTAKLKDLGVPGLWWLGPKRTPENLGDILLRNGWVGPNPMPAMVVDIAALKDSPCPKGTEIRPVETRDELATWHAVVAEGFGMSVEVAKIFDMPSPELGKFYTALVDGVPAAGAAVFFHAGVAGVYCVATLSDFRGRGIGGAITVFPLQEAARAGYKIGTLQASPMGHPVYKRLGFQDVATVDIYVYGMPPKESAVS